MSVQFFPLEGCRVDAAARQASLANSVVHLFTTALAAPDPSTPTSDSTSAEATYSGYAAQTLAAWFDPILAPGSGYMIQSPWVQFEFADTPGTPGNQINGLFMLDSAGKNRLVVIFDQPIPMQISGQGIGFNLTILFPTGL